MSHGGIEAVRLVEKKSIASLHVPFFVISLDILSEEHAEGNCQKKPNDVREFHARRIYQA
jgi:hypothetical protein